MKVALVHDDFFQWGGAEQLFTVFAEMFPEAPLYTLGYSNDLAPKLTKRIFTAPANKLPLVQRFYKVYSPLYPLLTESFKFQGYDLVISSSARFAHGVITQPPTIHIAYVNSPGRMWWESDDYFYQAGISNLMRPLLHYFRMWDSLAAQRPDLLIANSHNVAQKIKKYWQRDAHVIYPFIKELPPVSEIEIPQESGYYLIVSRLVAWKRIDLVIKAFNELGKPLIIIGDGPFAANLKKYAKNNIKFRGYLTDRQKHGYYRNCIALIQPQNEDFGLTPVEAMAWGKGVIAYGGGGAIETVTDKTGILFTDASVSGIIEAVQIFTSKNINESECISQANKFKQHEFISQFQEVLRINGLL